MSSPVRSAWLNTARHDILVQYKDRYDASVTGTERKEMLHGLKKALKSSYGKALPKKLTKVCKCLDLE